MTRNMRDINATRTSGSGELPALLKETERAIPVVATAQLVVASRRVRQILLRYISPLYKCASIPSSAPVKGFLGFSAALMRLLPVKDKVFPRVPHISQLAWRLQDINSH